MTDGVSVAEAARRLHTTPPTLRGLLERGELEGVKLPRGTRFAWRVDEPSLQRYEAAHGKFPRRRPARPARLQELERQVATLASAASAPGEVVAERTRRERDDLRATVVMLRETLARTRTIAELQQRADTERAAMVEHLLAAVSAGERADSLRQAAIEELNEAVAAASRAGHLGQLGAESEPS